MPQLDEGDRDMEVVKKFEPKKLELKMKNENDKNNELNVDKTSKNTGPSARTKAKMNQEKKQLIFNQKKLRQRSWNHRKRIMYLMKTKFARM